MQTVRAVMQTLHHSLELIKCISLVFDYLFVDSSRYESLFKLFTADTQLVTLVVHLIGKHQEFD